ncbi:hypothetical protein FIBSPDRAFT_879230, partial [Athelia psychrophila]
VEHLSPIIWLLSAASRALGAACCVSAQVLSHSETLDCIVALKNTSDRTAALSTTLRAAQTSATSVIPVTLRTSRCPLKTTIHICACSCDRD